MHEISNSVEDLPFEKSTKSFHRAQDNEFLN
jgi:hypothetical protein